MTQTKPGDHSARDTNHVGPEVPTGPYKHPACMTELKNGDLYLVFYGVGGVLVPFVGIKAIDLLLVAIHLA